ncbi:Anaphase-promoting complex subunit 2 [Rhizoclosmatium sp. JEL0117]|nr:Anaphase-promoting complex subunit 2 [Rhizoclosmatium sp. JEL0117]
MNSYKYARKQGTAIEDCVQHNESPMEQSYLEQYLCWGRDTLVPWLNKVLGSCSDITGNQIEYHIYQVFCNLRINKLFEIIVDFPNSEPALTELKVCVFETDRYKFLKASLNRIISRRLLHLGAQTSDIVSIFVSSIKCLNFLDPTGDLLSSISMLIRNYLRTRPDSMRSVINILTGDAKDSDDMDLENSTISNTFSDILLRNGFKGKVLRDQQLPADITTSLVKIFDSPDVFIKEFQTLLGDRLISRSDYETDRELKNLELLKKHFSEAGLHQCEVMIKDLMDSKRINTNICNNMDPESRFVNMKVLSRLFWPQFTFEPQNHPPCVSRFLEKYDALYSKLKSMRSLRHLTNYGTVDLDLEFEDRTLSLTVTPAQASIIGFFDGKDTLSLSQLVNLSGKSAQSVEKLVSFWKSKGVLKQNMNATISVVERIDDEGALVEQEMTDVRGHEEVEQNVEAIPETVKMFRPFVQAMLGNLGSLPVDRIYTSLKAFGFTESQDKLRAYLDSLIEEDLLEAAGGNVYSLRKK